MGQLSKTCMEGPSIKEKFLQRGFQSCQKGSFGKDKKIVQDDENNVKEQLKQQKKILFKIQIGYYECQKYEETLENKKPI